MAQRVRMYVWGKALGDGNFLDDAADAARGEPPSTPVDEQRGRVLADGSKNFLALGEIGSQRRFHRIAERNIAFFLPLAADENRFRTQPNVVEVDSRELR